MWWLANHHDAVELFARLGTGAVVVLEPDLALSAELATLVVRRPSGAMAHYPLVRTYQQDGICHTVVVPALVAPRLAAQAAEWAEAIAEAVGMVGVLAVEFFVHDDQLLVNELAPAPHNSGHYTVDACATSHFENHLHAVLDLPLGSTGMTVPAAVMANLIGTVPSLAQVAKAAPGPPAHVHLYGKQGRPGRKVGHVTLCGADRVALKVAVEVMARDMASDGAGPAPSPFTPAAVARVGGIDR